MKITPNTTIAELDAIKPFDFISDSMNKSGRVQHVSRTVNESFIDYKIEIYANRDGVYNKEYIYAKR
jgi:hypothetical protein